MQPSRLTAGLQITDHFLTDDAPIYVNKGNQRQMRDQSCGQRQGPVLALMINTLPPATSLAVAPWGIFGSSWVAALSHLLNTAQKMCEIGRQGTTSCFCCLSNLSRSFNFSSCREMWQKNTMHEERRWDVWLLMFFHKHHTEKRKIKF